MKINRRLLKYKLNTFDYKKIKNKSYFNRYKSRLLALYMYNEYGLEPFIKTLTKYSKNKFFEILDKDFPNIKLEINTKFKLILNDPIDRLRVFTLKYTPNYCIKCNKQTSNKNYCSVLCAQNSKNIQYQKNQTQHNKNYNLYITKYKIKQENIIEFNDIYNNKQEFKIKCNKCSEIFSTTGERLNEKKYPELCRACISIIGGDNQKNYYSKEYNCKECNEKFTSTNFKYINSPYCSNNCKTNSRLRNLKQRVDENLRKTAKEMNLKIIATDEELLNYKTVKNFMNFECSCGKSFYNSIFNIQNRLKNKRECICKNMTGVSNGEIEVREFINNLGFKTINNKFLNNVSLDILYGNMAIEYNGLYWHSDEFKSKGFHKNKTKVCLEAGVYLFHIFSNEWEQKREIWESIIKNKLNMNKKISSLECNIKEIDNKEMSDFLNNNHLYGSIETEVNIGLYNNNELISVMGFKYYKKDKWKMLRVCNKLNYNVTNIGILLNYFEEKYKPKKLISYTDIRWDNGELLTEIGFVHLKDLPPFGWYFKDGTNEIEGFPINLENRGKYKKIYDCGMKKYVKIY